MSTLQEEISRRRTFAIISHPDAGKTTLTEKFLLYGGAIAQAGAVKGKKNARAAVSDWMEIEKQRGISVTSSVRLPPRSTDSLPSSVSTWATPRCGRRTSATRRSHVSPSSTCIRWANGA